MKNKENQIINLAEKAIVYLPKHYFEKELAEWRGEEVNTIAIFYVEIFTTSVTPELYKISLSTMINIRFNEVIEVEKEFQVLDIDDDNDSEETENNKEIESEENNSTEVQEEVIIKKKMKYYGLVVNKNEILFPSTIHVMHLNNTKAYIRFIQQAKIPNDIPYNETVRTYKYNSELNGISLGIPDILLEVMMGELLRDQRDETIPFRKIAGKTGKNFGYRSAKLKELPFINSVFQGLAFENINIAIQKGLKLSKNNKNQAISPIEEVIHY